MTVSWISTPLSHACPASYPCWSSVFHQLHKGKWHNTLAPNLFWLMVAIVEPHPAESTFLHGQRVSLPGGWLSRVLSMFSSGSSSNYSTLSYIYSQPAGPNKEYACFYLTDLETLISMHHNKKPFISIVIHFSSINYNQMQEWPFDYNVRASISQHCMNMNIIFMIHHVDAYKNNATQDLYTSWHDRQKK